MLKYYIGNTRVSKWTVKDLERKGIAYHGINTIFVADFDKLNNIHDEVEEIRYNDITIWNITDNHELYKIAKKAKLIYKYRKDKDYENADKIRNELIKSGYKVKYN